MKKKYTDKYLAMMSKYDNPTRIGNIKGIVMQGFPEIKIGILNGSVILYPEMLYFAEHLLEGYKRECSQEGTLRFSDKECGRTSSEYAGSSSHSHSVSSLNVDTQFSEEGSITFTDTLKKGDEVMICPTEQQDKFFVVTKVKQVI